MSSAALSQSAKLLLLVSLLSKDRIITNNQKAILKELILRRDPRLHPLLAVFESRDTSGNNLFVEKIHELILSESESLYGDLFIDTSLEVGKALSKDEREKKNLAQEKSLIYGEVEFNSFYTVLRKINAKPGLVFYDLGSGTGKAVFAARLTQDFSKCIGIEILHNLHEQAAKIVTRYNRDFEPLMSLSNDDGAAAAVFEGSFLDFDWSDGDVVFANSTCYDDDLMSDMTREAQKLKPGAIMVTFTKGLTNMKHFELLERKRQKMSWGPATVFIHRRLCDDGSPAGEYRLNVLPSDSITYDDDSSYSSATGDSMVPQFDGSVSNQYDDEDDEDEEDYEDEEQDEDEDEDGDNGAADYEFNSDIDEGESPGLLSYPEPQSPPSRKGASPSLNIGMLPNASDPSFFKELTSPQDNALLMRKRNQQLRAKSRSTDSQYDN